MQPMTTSWTFGLVSSRAHQSTGRGLAAKGTGPTGNEPGRSGTPTAARLRQGRCTWHGYAHNKSIWGAMFCRGCGGTVIGITVPLSRPGA